MGKCLLWLMLVLSVFAEDCLAGDDPYVLQLQQLAGQGDDESRFALALLYEYGEQGVARDPEKAVALFLQAGQAGIPAACLYLASNMKMAYAFSQQDQDDQNKFLDDDKKSNAKKTTKK